MSEMVGNTFVGGICRTLSISHFGKQSGFLLFYFRFYITTIPESELNIILTPFHHAIEKTCTDNWRNYLQASRKKGAIQNGSSP